MLRWAVGALPLSVAVDSPNCATFSFCGSCTDHKTWSGDNCRWCPNDGACHGYASLYNPCSKNEQIVDVDQCPTPTQPPPPLPPAPANLHWCDGVALGELPIDDIKVLYVQAPLFSTNPSIGGALGVLGLHHTALVFQQGDVYWTLEFDVTAQNKADHGLGDGFLPKVSGLGLTWDNDARWCLTDGLLHGRDHWTTSFDTFAQISPTQFKTLVHDFVPSLNGTANGLDVGYNLFRVMDQSSGEELIGDVTCANGAIWVRDYLVAQNIPVSSALDFKVTRVEIDVDSVSEVTEQDTVLWQEVIDFYKAFRGISDGGLAIAGQINAVTALFPMQFAYDSNMKKFFKLNHAKIPIGKFRKAPEEWHLPSTVRSHHMVLA